MALNFMKGIKGNTLYKRFYDTMIYKIVSLKILRQYTIGIKILRQAIKKGLNFMAIFYIFEKISSP